MADYCGWKYTLIQAVFITWRRCQQSNTLVEYQHTFLLLSRNTFVFQKNSSLPSAEALTYVTLQYTKTLLPYNITFRRLGSTHSHNNKDSMAWKTYASYLGHLDDGKQGVIAAQDRWFNWHANNRKRSHGSNHTRQVCCTSCPSNDDLWKARLQIAMLQVHSSPPTYIRIRLATMTHEQMYIFNADVVRMFVLVHYKHSQQHSPQWINKKYVGFLSALCCNCK